MRLHQGAGGSGQGGRGAVREGAVHERPAQRRAAPSTAPATAPLAAQRNRGRKPDPRPDGANATAQDGLSPSFPFPRKPHPPLDGAKVHRLLHHLGIVRILPQVHWGIERPRPLRVQVRDGKARTWGGGPARVSATVTRAAGCSCNKSRHLRRRLRREAGGHMQAAALRRPPAARCVREP